MSRLDRWLLLGSSLLTGVTGLVYMWMKYALEPAEPFAVVNHPWQPFMLKAHIVVSPVMIFAVGLVARDHIFRHFRRGVRVGRRTGVLAMLVFVPMVLSGYLIQAVTHVGWLRALVLVHIGTGCLYLGALFLHQKIFRRRDGKRAGGEPEAGERRAGKLEIGEGAAGEPETGKGAAGEPEPGRSATGARDAEAGPGGSAAGTASAGTEEEADGTGAVRDEARTEGAARQRHPGPVGRRRGARRTADPGTPTRWTG